MKLRDLLRGVDVRPSHGDLDADKVAHWNGATWSALGSASAFGDGGNSVYALAVNQGAVFAAGFFNNADGNAKIDGVGAFVDGAWSNVGTDAAGANGPVWKK